MAEWSSNVERFEVQTRKKKIRSGELSIILLYIFLLKQSWGFGVSFLNLHSKLPSCEFSVVLQGTHDPCPWSAKYNMFPGKKKHATFKRQFLLVWWTQTFLKLPNIQISTTGTYRSSSSLWRLFSIRLQASGQSHVSSSPARSPPGKNLVEVWKEQEDQPLWKICPSNWVHLPQVGRGKNSKNAWVATT